MTNKEAVKRSERSQNLKVFRLEDSPWFYVESEEGKICYKVCYNNETDYYCNCGDFARGFKNDTTFKCKHVMAVMASVTEGDPQNVRFLERWRPKLEDTFIKRIDDKDFVLYAGLLDVAHQKNLCTVDVELIQNPSAENGNTAICKARVETVDGRRFADIGDANPQNCNSKVAKHLIRMASTRAKARAFRDMDNIGMTALEELGDLNDIIGDNDSKRVSQRTDNIRKLPRREKAAPKPENGDAKKVEAAPEETSGQSAPVETQSAPEKTPANPDKENGNGRSGKKTSPMISEAQKNAIYNLSRRRNLSIEDLENLAMKAYNLPVENLTASDASAFIRTLQQAS